MFRATRVSARMSASRKYAGTNGSVEKALFNCLGLATSVLSDALNGRRQPSLVSCLLSHFANPRVWTTHRISAQSLICLRDQKVTLRPSLHMIPVALPSVEMLLVLAFCLAATFFWFVWTLWLAVRYARGRWCRPALLPYSLVTPFALFTLWQFADFYLQVWTYEGERAASYRPELPEPMRLGQIDMPKGTKLELAVADQKESFNRAVFPNPVRIADIDAVEVSRYVAMKTNGNYEIVGFSAENMRIPATARRFKTAGGAIRRNLSSSISSLMAAYWLSANVRLPMAMSLMASPCPKLLRSVFRPAMSTPMGLPIPTGGFLTCRETHPSVSIISI